MSGKPNVGKIIKEQRKNLSLSLKQLSRLSGVSVSHLGRVEQGKRGASTRTLQKIAEPLGFDLYELLVMTGHLLPGSSLYSDEQREKLRVELNRLLERVGSDTKRIKEIVNRLILSK
ncbi:helix-turn-helix domain-containing protein [Chloroflexota bacterium]